MPYSLLAQHWIAQDGISPADLQTSVNTNSDKGYRLTALTGYTANGKENYLALWQQTKGPAWVARYGMSTTEYQTTFNTFINQGFRLSSLSAYTVNNVAKFAAIWEKKVGGAWVAKHHMTSAAYQRANVEYASKGYHLQHICGYVINGTEYFAGIWEMATSNLRITKHNMTSVQYQAAFSDLTSKGYLLKEVNGYSKKGIDLYVAIWERATDPLCYTYHGVPSTNYQHTLDNMYYQGYQPKMLNAFSSGSGVKFNMIWTNSNGFAAAIAKIDSTVNKYMQAQAVNGLSIAICKDGRLVFAKGYGYANPATAEEMSPNHSLRIMSISKPITTVGIMTLIEQGKLSEDQLVFGKNGILGKKYGTPADKPQLDSIRVKDLLWHTSGLRSCNGEAVFWDANKTTADAMQVLLSDAHFIHNRAGLVFEYSNANYFILARIIEQVSEQPYEAYIRQHILNKCGIGSSMHVGQASGNLKAGEVSYTPMSNMNLQLWDGFGGWVARPMDLLRFLNRVDGCTSTADIIATETYTKMTTGSKANPAYGFGWEVTGNLQNHNGCYGASRSYLVEMDGGVSYCVITNSEPRNDGGWVMKAEIEKGLNKITAYPTYNLFGNSEVLSPKPVATTLAYTYKANFSLANKIIITEPRPK